MKFKLILIAVLIYSGSFSTQTDANKNAIEKEDFTDDLANISKYQKENELIGLPKKEKSG